MRIRVAACQINTVVGDLRGNVDRILEALAHAEAQGAQIAVFPELAVTGYPPEDLLLKPSFIDDNRAAIAEIGRASRECVGVVGFVDVDRDLFNAAAVCSRGELHGVYRKRLLPNYAVFDEERYFTPGSGDPVLFDLGGAVVGVSICEDVWSPGGPIAAQAGGGADVVVNLSASPFHAGRLLERRAMLATRAADASCALVYVNQVGGQDELVFDGGSMLFDSGGHLVGAAPQFVEGVFVVDLDLAPVFRKRLLDPRGRVAAPRLPLVAVPARSHPGGPPPPTVRCDPLPPVDEVYEALVLGTRDYVEKNSFSDVVIGLSGGVDSALVAAVAVDALGPARVHPVAMPSRFSSEASLSDAAALARNLGVHLRTIPIEAAHASLCSMLASAGLGPSGLTDENLQSRIRGVVLMALANEHGWLVLTTGNKSEADVGYSTLYGDTAGGFAVIKDVAKTLVYALCRRRNERAGFALIPEEILVKAPSAELRPGQRDDDTLPSYDVLDAILDAYVEQDRSAADIAATGLDAELVRSVVALVDRAEYKRRQTPPGVRVTPKAFGKDRRVPITNRYEA